VLVLIARGPAGPFREKAQQVAGRYSHLERFSSLRKFFSRREKVARCAPDEGRMESNN
jgi:hypothetical protein